MADVKLNKNTFTIILGVMVALILIMAGILIVHFAAPGLIAGITGIFGGDEPVIEEEEEEGPWGDKVYSWTYNGEKFQIELYISKEAYQNSNNPLGGYDLAGYIIDDQDGTVSLLASNLKRLAAQKELSDRETVDFAVSFVQGLTYSPDKTSGHSTAYPRTPTVTLAEQTGDSKDLSILAAAVIDKMGFPAAVLSYPANNFGGTYVPSAAALAVPGDSNANGPVYNITKGDKTKNLEVTWIANTESLGFPDVAYFVDEPEIITAKNFWSGKAFAEKAGPVLPTADVFGIPDLEYIPDVSWNTWKKEMSEFYSAKWYDTKVSWKSSASWKFYEHTLNVQPTPANLAKPSEDGILPGSLWRLSYTVTPNAAGEGIAGVESIMTGEFDSMGNEETVEIDFTGLTPYSAVEIAVYDISSGEPVLLDTFGWQGENLANSPQTSPVYPPGKYAVGLYVRNADVEIMVQCSDNLNEVTYMGGI